MFNMHFWAFFSLRYDFITLYYQRDDLMNLYNKEKAAESARHISNGRGKK